MNKPVIRKILYALPLLVIYFPLSAQTTLQSQQHKFGMDVDAGLAIPMDKSINSVFYTGLDASIGFKMAVLNNKKLWIKAVGAAKHYAKKANEIDKDVTETFDTWKAEIELQYRVADAKRYSFYPVLGIGQNWCSNYFSKPYDYNAATNTQTVAVSDNFLHGTGVSLDAGIMIVRAPFWYLKLDYDYFNPDLKVNTDLINATRQQGVSIPASVKFNCSTVNIGMGINLNFH